MLPLSVRLGPARFLDPLLVLLVVLGVALVLAFRRDGAAPVTITRHRARWPRILAWFAWAALWLLSLPFVARTLTAWIEVRGPDLEAALYGKDPQTTALVVLAAGLRTYDDAVPMGERLDAPTTQRVITASRLWRERGFGLVVVSGAPQEETAAMSDLMTNLGVPAERIVRETKALNTRDNAANVAQILRDRGAQAAVLVTSAIHLRRAAKNFAAVGINVIPAAADVSGRSGAGVDSLLPSAGALAQTKACLHEILGYIRG